MHPPKPQHCPAQFLDSCRPTPTTLQYDKEGPDKTGCRPATPLTTQPSPLARYGRAQTNLGQKKAEAEAAEAAALLKDFFAALR